MLCIAWRGILVACIAFAMQVVARFASRLISILEAGDGQGQDYLNGEQIKAELRKLSRLRWADNKLGST